MLIAEVSEGRALGPSIEPYIVPFGGATSQGQPVGEMRKGSNLDLDNSTGAPGGSGATLSRTSGGSDSTPEVASQPYEDSGYRFNAANQTRPPPLYTPE